MHVFKSIFNFFVCKFLKIFSICSKLSSSVGTAPEQNDVPTEEIHCSSEESEPYFSDNVHPPDFPRFIRTLKQIGEAFDELIQLSALMDPGLEPWQIDFRIHCLLGSIADDCRKGKRYAELGIQHFEWKLQNRPIDITIPYYRFLDE